jgi:non-lysosomal glucosylceramidase
MADGVGDAETAAHLHDEPGLVLCTWPAGGRPRLPFGYSDEVWTGVEYQVAASLLYEGMVEDAVAVVERVGGRHDGFVRNPWSENEAGHHYSR